MQRHLRAHGARLGTGARRKQLPLSDVQLRKRHAAGATLAELAAECGASPALIWRRIEFATQVSDGQQSATLNRIRLPADEIAAAYRLGEGINGLARRWNCSPSGIRHALRRAGVTMRPRGGVVRPVSSEDIVQLRDEERLSWTDIGTRTGLTEEGLRLRYEAATGQLPAREWHRTAKQRPNLKANQLRQLNAVVDLRDEIVDAYRTGQASARQLARDYGISDTTVRRWARARSPQ